MEAVRYSKMAEKILTKLPENDYWCKDTLSNNRMVLAGLYNMEEDYINAEKYVELGRKVTKELEEATRHALFTTRLIVLDCVQMGLLDQAEKKMESAESRLRQAMEIRKELAEKYQDPKAWSALAGSCRNLRTLFKATGKADLEKTFREEEERFKKMAEG